MIVKIRLISLFLLVFRINGEPKKAAGFFNYSRQSKTFLHRFRGLRETSVLRKTNHSASCLQKVSPV